MSLLNSHGMESLRGLLFDALTFELNDALNFVMTKLSKFTNSKNLVSTKLSKCIILETLYDETIKILISKTSHGTFFLTIR